MFNLFCHHILCSLGPMTELKRIAKPTFKEHKSMDPFSPTILFEISFVEFSISGFCFVTSRDFQRLFIKSERCCLFWSYLLEAFTWQVQGREIGITKTKHGSSICVYIFCWKGSLRKEEGCQQSSPHSTSSNGIDATSEPTQDREGNPWHDSGQQEVSFISRNKTIFGFGCQEDLQKTDIGLTRFQRTSVKRMF